MLDRAAVSVLVSPAIAASPRPSDADGALALAVVRGDRVAEEMLYRRHAPSVLRLATRLLRSHEEALDVLQDTFVAAFEDIGALRDPDAFRPWVHRVAVRLVHRRFRKRKLLTMLGLGREPAAISLEDLADERGSPESRVELRWLDAALCRLDDKTRIAWMLRHVEGLSLEETAEACDCSLATAKRRIAAGDAVVKQHAQGGVA